jgi:hypothetical protein
MVAEFARPMPLIARDDMSPSERDAITEKIVETMEVYTESVERILGLESGQLQLIDTSMMQIITGERK